tara:strand:- start:1015 stop:1197 length:183 start_codon:yes stop_codon:yes gene_type:complete
MSECNEGHAHEALDRCHTLQVMIEELLTDHPGIVKAGAANDILAAQTLIGEAYQKVGQLD